MPQSFNFKKHILAFCLGSILSSAVLADVGPSGSGPFDWIDACVSVPNFTFANPSVSVSVRYYDYRGIEHTTSLFVPAGFETSIIGAFESTKNAGIRIARFVAGEKLSNGLKQSLENNISTAMMCQPDPSMDPIFTLFINPSQNPSVALIEPCADGEVFCLAEVFPSTSILAMNRASPYAGFVDPYVRYFEHMGFTYYHMPEKSFLSWSIFLLDEKHVITMMSAPISAGGGIQQTSPVA